MAIENDDQLRDAVAQISCDLADIQTYLGRTNKVDGRIRFPRGFIRTAAECRREFSFVSSDILKKNISYTLMMTDVLRWLATRTDLSATVLNMIVKEGICLLANICESATKEFLYGKGGSKPYKDRTRKLVELSIIDQDLKTDIDWLWDTRGRLHLYTLDQRDDWKYERTDYKRARRALSRLCDHLNEHANTGS